MLIHLNKNTDQIIYLAYVNLCHSERRHAKSTDIFVDPELVTLTHNQGNTRVKSGGVII